MIAITGCMYDMIFNIIVTKNKTTQQKTTNEHQISNKTCVLTGYTLLIIGLLEPRVPDNTLWLVHFRPH